MLMTKITIEDCVYSVHPIYDLYAGSEDGYVINIIKKVPMNGVKCNRGYMLCNVRKHGQSGHKAYQVHRFVWECHKGIIQEGKVIDHINNNKEDNRLCNLELMTQQKNSKKAAKDRDYKFVANNHKNKKCVKATNKNTNEVSYYNSMYAIQQHLKINVGIVKMTCDGINNCKSGVSKKDGHSYTFEYVKKDDMPVNYIKSANIRPKKVSNDEKKKQVIEAIKNWQKKEYKCDNCGKIMKNHSRCYHKKHCNNTQK